MLLLTGRWCRQLQAGIPPIWLRSSSNFARIRNDLTTRQLPLCYDYLSPQQSHLLNLTLSQFIPGSGPHSSPTNGEDFRLPSTTESRDMPAGHHLVYFPPQVPNSQVLTDGTDILHYPGPPFNRRLWAGGWVRFYGKGGPRLDGQRAVCMEGIRNVTVSGNEGSEKLFVGIERRVATVREAEEEQSICKRVWMDSEEDPGDAVVIERRNLVFMRDKTQEEVISDKSSTGKPAKAIRAPLNAQFVQTLVPSRALLFRFSALTFNAHSIHLDRDYARNVEGYPDLLVHGPLTLAMMLTVCANHISNSGRVIESIEYRNLAPLFVEQQIKICGKPKNKGSFGAYDIWIEGPNGGLAVKGSMQTASHDRPEKQNQKL